MDASTKDAVDLLHVDLRAVFGDRLQALVVYGAHARRAPDASVGERVSTLALVQGITFRDLSGCSAHGAKWAKRNLAVPLLLTGDEFLRSLDAFPLEYGDIIRHHIVVAGTDPFPSATVRPDDLRRGCEVQAKSHLIHLREGFVEARGDARAVAALIAASARPFAALLTNVLRLQDIDPATPAQLAQSGEAALGLPASVTTRVMNAAGSPLVPADAIALYPEYLGAVERLWRLVDEWRGFR